MCDIPESSSGHQGNIDDKPMQPTLDVEPLLPARPK